MESGSVHRQHQDMQDQMQNQAHITMAEHMYNDQVTQEQLMQLMNKSSPEQLQQMLNVFRRNKSNIVDHKSNAVMTGGLGREHLPTGESTTVSHVGNLQLSEGPLIWEGQGDW